MSKKFLDYEGLQTYHEGVKNALNNHKHNDLYVALKGNQSVSGIKTFDDTVNINKSMVMKGQTVTITEIDGEVQKILTSYNIRPDVNNTGGIGHENYHLQLGYINSLRSYQLLPTKVEGGNYDTGIGTIGAVNSKWLSGYINNIYTKTLLLDDGNNGYTSGTSGQVLMTNGSSVYWGDIDIDIDIDTDDFADKDHNHDDDYAALDHDHGDIYAYSDHNHDGSYSALGHDHGDKYSYSDHNHDDEYSDINHDHDDKYAALDHDHDDDYVGKEEIDGIFTIKLNDYAEKDHNHDDKYSGINHNHDDKYSGINHNHDDEYSDINHNHDNLYSPLNHNHDDIYAALRHTHDELYATKEELENIGIDLSDYALADHNHDDKYSDINHNHGDIYAGKDHNHNSSYAALGHNHDSSYAALGHNHDSSYAALGHDHGDKYAYSDHNHDSSYAALGHNHDSSYAALNHDHADYIRDDKNEVTIVGTLKPINGIDLNGTLSIEAFIGFNSGPVKKYKSMYYPYGIDFVEYDENDEYVDTHELLLPYKSGTLAVVDDIIPSPIIDLGKYYSSEPWDSTTLNDIKTPGYYIFKCKSEDNLGFNEHYMMTVTSADITGGEYIIQTIQEIGGSKLIYRHYMSTSSTGWEVYKKTLATLSDVSGGDINLGDYALADHNHDNKYLSIFGGDMIGDINMDAGFYANTGNFFCSSIKWDTMDGLNPYIGYDTELEGGAFVISTEGTTRESGLSITSGNNGLLWKGNKVATVKDLEKLNTSDTKVTQDYSTSGASYPLLMSATSDLSSTSSRGATTAIVNNQIYANPSAGIIAADSFQAKRFIEAEKWVSSGGYFYLSSNDSSLPEHNFGDDWVETYYYGQGIDIYNCANDNDYYLKFPVNKTGTFALLEDLTTASTYGTGTAGQVLMTDGTNTYWGNVSGGSDGGSYVPLLDIPNYDGPYAHTVESMYNLMNSTLGTNECILRTFGYLTFFGYVRIENQGSIYFVCISDMSNMKYYQERVAYNANFASLVNSAVGFLPLSGGEMTGNIEMNSCSIDFSKGGIAAVWRDLGDGWYSGFGWTDEGRPTILCPNDERTISISTGDFDGSYWNYTFPEKDGTVALTSDITAVVAAAMPKYYMHTISIDSTSSPVMHLSFMIIRSSSDALNTGAKLINACSTNPISCSGYYGGSASNGVIKIGFVTSSNIRIVYGHGASTTTVSISGATITDSVRAI